ncbi:hypothetical protein L1887_51604 [Cichorium endivia]|nr:hypothetical protein L1887_51604 [Cichorium endivia]
MIKQRRKRPALCRRQTEENRHKRKGRESSARRFRAKRPRGQKDPRLAALVHVEEQLRMVDGGQGRGCDGQLALATERGKWRKRAQATRCGPETRVRPECSKASTIQVDRRSGRPKGRRGPSSDSLFQLKPCRSFATARNGGPVHFIWQMSGCVRRMAGLRMRSDCWLRLEPRVGSQRENAGTGTAIGQLGSARAPSTSDAGG